MKLSVSVDELFVHVHRHNVGEEHVMRAEGNDLTHAALQRERTVRENGTVDLGGVLGGKVTSLKLIHLLARMHAAPVSSADKILGGEVDGEHAALLDDVVGVSGGAHRNIGFWGNGVDDSRPRNGEKVSLVSVRAGHDRRRNRC